MLLLGCHAKPLEGHFVVALHLLACVVIGSEGVLRLAIALLGGVNQFSHLQGVGVRGCRLGLPGWVALVLRLCAGSRKACHSKGQQYVFVIHDLWVWMG